MHYTNGKTFNIISVTQSIMANGEVRCCPIFINRSGTNDPFLTGIDGRSGNRTVSIPNMVALLTENFIQESSICLDNVVDDSAPPSLLNTTHLIEEITKPNCYCCGKPYKQSALHWYCVNDECEAVRVAHHRKLYRHLALGDKRIVDKLVKANYALAELQQMVKQTTGFPEGVLTKAESGFVLEQVKLSFSMSTLALYFLLLRLGVIQDKEKQTDMVLAIYDEYTHQSLMDIVAKLKERGEHGVSRDINAYLDKTKLSGWLLPLKAFNRIDS